MTKRTSFSGQMGNSAWSPSKNEFAFINTNGSGSWLFLLDATTGKLARLLGGKNDLIESVEWSSTGSTLLFLRGVGSKTQTPESFRQVCLLDRDGKNFRRLTDNWGGSYNAHWTADGRIVFRSDRSQRFDHAAVVPVQPDSSGIYSISADGSGESLLAPGVPRIWEVAVSR
jgi:Tol biopolymer transport system component